MFKNFRNKLKKFYWSKILGKKYYRTGKCNCCGSCCRKIYVQSAKGVIKDKNELEKLKLLHRFYTYLNVIGEDEIGLIFECTQLDTETNLCKIHDDRPDICRRYPQEEMFMMGGATCDDCGFKFEPIIPFEEVLQKTLKKIDKNKKQKQ